MFVYRFTLAVAFYFGGVFFAERAAVWGSAYCQNALVFCLYLYAALVTGKLPGVSVYRFALAVAFYFGGVFLAERAAVWGSAYCQNA
jgi:hypothetical protein